ncbi:NUMOD1 domain-containing DNA-binding protein [Enterococcus sp. LJL128]
MNRVEQRRYRQKVLVKLFAAADFGNKDAMKVAEAVGHSIYDEPLDRTGEILVIFKDGTSRTFVSKQQAAQILKISTNTISLHIRRGTADCAGRCYDLKI